jgi:hypothetical protein
MPAASQPSDMGRQPLSPFVERNPGGRYDVGTHSLGQRPELEAVIAKCLMAWPPVEAEMALVLAQLLGASESEAVLAVFHSLRRSTAQYQAISEAASVVLKEDAPARTLLDAILAVHKSTESDRNDLTHGHFGTYSNLPDGIIWMATNAYVDFKARMELARQQFTSGAAQELRSRLFFYKKPDLDRIFENTTDIADTWHAFTTYLRSAPPQRAELYRQLCDRPRIRQELDRRSRETNPQARPG